MRRRALHWLVLCFTTLWFGVLVPVHNRGEISLPGSGSAHCATGTATRATSPAAHCHAAASPSTSLGESLDESRPRPAPANPPKGSCAVCFFIATLDTPPPASLIETRLGLLGALDAAAPANLPAARATLPFHSRAPPAA